MALAARTVDISSLDAETFSRVMQNAVLLGARDAANKVDEKTGAEIIDALGVTGWRNGHKRFLKSAYSAGRFQIDTADLD